MLQDCTPIMLNVKALTATFSDDEKKRREGAMKNKDFYYGRQEQYVNLVNEDVEPITINLVNPIVTKRSSLLYNRPIVREFVGPQESVDYLYDTYTRINIDTILHKVDLAAELTGTCLVYVGMSDDDIYLLPYDAADFSVVSAGADNQYMDALSLVTLEYEQKRNGKSIDVQKVINTEIWTDNYIYYYNNGVKLTEVPNEYGFIPFVPFKAQEVNNQYLGHSPTISIRQLNQYLNQLSTHLGFMIKMQSATPVVLNGFSNGESVSVHPGTSISLPVGATAGVLSLNPKIMETMEFIKYIEEKVYQTSSIPRISIIGDQQGSTSGLELLIKWAPLVSVYKEKAIRYRQYELELANTILNIAGKELIDNINISWNEDGILPFDPSREQLEQNIKYGITTPIDEVLKINPDLSDEEAEALVLENLEFNKQIGGIDAQRSE